MITYEEQLGDSRDIVSGTNIVSNLDSRGNSKDYQEGAHESRTLYTVIRKRTTVLCHIVRETLENMVEMIRAREGIGRQRDTLLDGQRQCY